MSPSPITKICSGKIPRASFLDIWIFLFSGLSFFLSLVYTFSRPRLPGHFPPDFYALYVVAVLLLCFCAATIAFIQSPPLPKFDWRKWIFPSSLFLIALAAGLYHINYFSIWLDEEMQANAAKSLHSSLVDGAAFTQMPLSYYYTALNLSLFGYNEFGIRLLPCLFYVGSVVLFSRLINSYCHFQLVRCLAPIIFLTNPWIIRYAQEARPYSCALFCALLWLNVLMAFFQTHEKPTYRRHWFLLFVTATLLLYSISFQSMVLLLSLLCAVSPILFFSGWRQKIFYFYTSSGAAVFLALPIIQYTRNISSDFLWPGLNFNALQLTKFTFLRLCFHLFNIFGAQSFFILLSYICLIFYFFYKVYMGALLRRREAILCVSNLSFLFFGILFWLLFSLFINYAVNARYYLVAYPLGLLVSIFFLDEFLRNLRCIRSIKLINTILQASILLFLLATNILKLPPLYATNKFSRSGNQTRNLYATLSENGVAGDFAYMIPLQDPNGWEQNGFLESQFYYKVNYPVSLSPQWDIPYGKTASDLILNDAKKPLPKNVFLVFTNSPNVKPLSCSPLGEIQHERSCSGEGYFICKLAIGKSYTNTLEKFFSELIHSSQASDKYFRVYDILLNLSEYKNDSKKCFLYLNELKSLNSQNPKIMGIVREHEKKCAYFLK